MQSMRQLHPSQRIQNTSPGRLYARPGQPTEQGSWGRTELGPDIDCIDEDLTRLSREYTIDPARVAIDGFSAGASYALTVGVVNGDVVAHVLAFSPGCASLTVGRGAPLIDNSHGTQDTALPIDQRSCRVVPLLTEADYDITYREFDGPHAVPPEIADNVSDWFPGRHTAAATHTNQQDKRVNHR